MDVGSWVDELTSSTIASSLVLACFAGSRLQSCAYLALAAGSGRDVNKTASVLLALVGAALGGLGRLLGLDLGGLRLDLAGTRQTAVNLAHDGCVWCCVCWK